MMNALTPQVLPNVGNMLMPMRQQQNPLAIYTGGQQNALANPYGTQETARAQTGTNIGTMTGDIADYAAALRNVESGSRQGNYKAVGPKTKKGNRAYGAYQVMDFNIPSWTREVLGRAYTPQEFLNDPAAQDAVFNAKFGSYVKKYGNPQDAAAAWFSGRPLAGNTSSDGWATVPQYVSKFNSGL